MTETNYTLPPRKWYTLEQAAKRINKLTGEEIEVDDLIHYWKIRKLEICAYCLVTPEEIKIGENIICDDGFSLAIHYNYIEESDYIYKIENILEMIKLYEQGDTYFYELEAIDNITNMLDIEKYLAFSTKTPIADEICGGIFYINGFLSVIPRKEISIVNKVYFDKNIIQFATPKNNENDERIIIEILNFDEYVHLDKNQLYILNNDLEDFLNNRTSPPEPPQKEKQPTTKTLNSQAEFIRNLIIMSYGEEVADGIRKELDNPNSEISIDFQTKGLKAPSGKTVDRWINQI